MSRPLLLDLFCGAGGAAVGYHRAGFDVIGVDINPQPRYPYHFILNDALSELEGGAVGFDAIHASPPCQGYSAMSNSRPGIADEYPRLIEPVRELLQATSLPYVIENVPGAKAHMHDPVTLCGQMFGLELYRHRLFESNVPMWQPEHPAHVMPASKAGHWKPGTVMSVAGHVSPIAKAREVMGIDWMTRDELAESIPPAFTEHVGEYLMLAVTERAS